MWNNTETIAMFNAAQDIAQWAKQNNWDDDWVIGEIASKKGYDKILQENIELKNKIEQIKKFVSKL